MLFLIKFIYIARHSPCEFSITRIFLLILRFQIYQEYLRSRFVQILFFVYFWEAKTICYYNSYVNNCIVSVVTIVYSTTYHKYDKFYYIFSPRIKATFHNTYKCKYYKSIKYTTYIK